MIMRKTNLKVFFAKSNSWFYHTPIFCWTKTDVRKQMSETKNTNLFMNFPSFCPARGKNTVMCSKNTYSLGCAHQDSEDQNHEDEEPNPGRKSRFFRSKLDKFWAHVTIICVTMLQIYITRFYIYIYIYIWFKIIIDDYYGHYYVVTIMINKYIYISKL